LILIDGHTKGCPAGASRSGSLFTGSHSARCLRVCRPLRRSSDGGLTPSRGHRRSRACTHVLCCHPFIEWNQRISRPLAFSRSCRPENFDRERAKVEERRRVLGAPRERDTHGTNSLVIQHPHFHSMTVVPGLYQFMLHRLVFADSNKKGRRRKPRRRFSDLM